jgi:hypothetical protein
MFQLPALTRPYAGGSYAHGLLARADRIIKEIGAVQTSEVAASAFTFGLIQGRFKAQGGLTVFALPVDLLAGVTFHALGLFGFARPYNQHLRAFGDGALASFFTTTGYRVGERAALSGSLFKSLFGMFGDDSGKEPAGGSTIADKQLDELVRAG